MNTRQHGKRYSVTKITRSVLCWHQERTTSSQLNLLHRIKLKLAKTIVSVHRLTDRESNDPMKTGANAVKVPEILLTSSHNKHAKMRDYFRSFKSLR